MAKIMAEIKNIDLEKRHLDLLRHIIKEYCPNKQIWAYGSRVTFRAKNTSDIDLVIFNCHDKEYYALKDALDESNIPFLIQIMRWEQIPQSFKDTILENYFVISNTI